MFYHKYRNFRFIILEPHERILKVAGNQMIQIAGISNKVFAGFNDKTF
jgi:hypothetical protein